MSSLFVGVGGLAGNAAFINFSFQHNPAIYSIVASMQSTQFKFNPKLLYKLAFPQYAGGNEVKAKVKRLGNYAQTLRVVNINLIEDKTTSRHDDINKMALMDHTDFADRIVDVVYSDFDDDFNSLKQSISNHLVYSYNKSNGKLAGAVMKLQERYDVICSNIRYLKETGIDAQLENSKRNEGYEQALQELRELLRDATQLSYTATILFKSI